jgi:hypothetical protein
MTILTGRELEVLIGLQMSWGESYSKELARLQNKDDSKCAIEPAAAYSKIRIVWGHPAYGSGGRLQLSSVNEL